VRGHVLRRGPTWNYVIDVGRDPASGRRRPRTKGGFRTKREAEQALATVIRTLGEVTYVARDPQTLEEWIKRGLVTMAPKVRSSTLRDYANGLGRVSDRLGQLPLQALRPLDIEEMYASLPKEGHRYGGGLAPKTVRNLHIALRRSLADAHRLGLVPRNVAALVKPPVPVRHEIATWTADEVRRFLGAVEGDRLAPAYRLLAATGMRRGEALGLHWANVDLDAARIVVNRSLTVVNDEMVWASPKTSRSRRSLSLDADTVVVLRAHRRRQLEERLNAGELWQDNDLVFCNETGKAPIRIVSRARSPQPRVAPESGPFVCTTFATPGRRWRYRPASIRRLSASASDMRRRESRSTFTAMFSRSSMLTPRPPSPNSSATRTKA
jgi:integrase